MDFYPGRKVICIADFASFRGWEVVENKPKLNGIYTVRAVVILRYADGDGEGLHLAEISNPVRDWTTGTFEISFDTTCFRPLDERETDISIFQQLLTPQPARELV